VSGVGWLVRPEEAVPYAAANAAMHILADQRLAGEIPDTLVLLEHQPVYTAGRRSRDEHLVEDESAIRARGADVHHVDRGGSFTFHGPGQLIGYPILDLGTRPDALGYVRRLEEVIIRAGADLGIALSRSPVQTGVWSGSSKVCAIGVRIKRMRVALHGFALNCTTDLAWFDAIVPCGLTSTDVASLSSVARRRVAVEDAEPAVIARFEEVFELSLVPAPANAVRSFRPHAESPEAAVPSAARLR
jgi:lipoyl(octanoyl) transferase